MAGKRWGTKIYDYEREEITDDAAAEVDLEMGRWIRCRPCGKIVKSLGAFTTHTWLRHKRSGAHCDAVRADNTRRLNRTAPRGVSHTREYADFATAMMESIDKDTDYLVFYRQELQKRAKEELQAKELIQKMALLVTEQQEDIEHLRSDISDIKKGVRELHRQVNQLAADNADMRRRYLPTEVIPMPITKPAFIEVFDSDEEDDTTTCTKTSDGMDMFDDQVQLMQLD